MPIQYQIQPYTQLLDFHGRKVLGFQLALANDAAVRSQLGDVQGLWGNVYNLDVVNNNLNSQLHKTNPLLTYAKRNRLRDIYIAIGIIQAQKPTDPAFQALAAIDREAVAIDLLNVTKKVAIVTLRGTYQEAFRHLIKIHQPDSKKAPNSFSSHVETIFLRFMFFELFRDGATNYAPTSWTVDQYAHLAQREIEMQQIQQEELYTSVQDNLTTNEEPLVELNDEVFSEITLNFEQILDSKLYSDCGIYYANPGIYFDPAFDNVDPNSDLPNNLNKLSQEEVAKRMGSRIPILIDSSHNNQNTSSIATHSAPTRKTAQEYIAEYRSLR